MEKLKFVVLGHVPASYQVQDANTTVNISQTLSAYEVTTAKVLIDESNQLQKNDQLCPKVFCASSNDWLVVSVESDIHIFDMSMGCTEFHPDKGRKEKHTSLEPGDGKTVALSFLPSCEIFMVVQNTGTIKFSSPANRLIYKKDLVISQIADCSMQIAKSTDDLAYMACLLDRQHSIVHFIKIPQYDFSIRDEEALSAHFSSVECTRTVQLGYMGAHFVVTMMGSYIFFPKDKGQLVSKISTYPEGFGEISQLFTLDENLAMVRSVGSTIVVLLPSGKLMLFDECLVQLCTLCPFYNDDEFETVLDFEFLDGDALELNQNLKILFKVKTATGIKFKIKHFNQTTEEFSTDCSRHAILIPITAPDDDNSIVYVDPFPNQMTDSILIRIVSEAQPVIRLNKLLELKRFEAARNFAKSNNLSMDLIFAAIVRHCQEQIQATEGGDYDEALFLEMKHNLTQLTNHNMAADLCLASLTLLTCFGHIKTLLEFTNRLKITDEYTRNEIARFSYEFASYRMVYGFEDAAYGPGSMWREFESSETHKEFFDHFCEQGKIAEARILFSRYIEIPRNITKPEIIRKLLSTFQQAITANPSLCPEIGEFFESDLIPIFFYTGDSPKNICIEICDFFIAISLQLEQIQAKLFPKNALNFAQTFNRAIQFLKRECRTTDQYVAFLLILKQLDEEGEPNPEDSTSSIVKLKKLIRNLTKLIKIHDTYQCPMSYAEFLSENVHSICHRILDRLRAVQSVRQHIEQFVFPYIEEHRLDRNEMLHAYIKELASANRYTKSIQHGNNTWDILCLQIAEQITDMNMRCRAIIEIANGTMPPWNQQLTNVIKGIFSTQTDKIDPELVSKLREQYLYADLGQIFIQYQIPLDVRSRIVGNSAIKSLLRFIFKNSDKEMAIKIQDALKIVEIYGCLFQTSKLEQQPLTSVDCHYLYATVLLQHFTDEWEIRPLIDLFQLIKAPEDVQEVATKLIIHIKTLLEPSEIKKIISRRPIWLACLLCVLERFKQENPQCSDLIQKARNIRTLQQNYKIIVGFETFQNKAKCEDILRDFIESSSLEKKSITVIDVKCFGNLLCFSIVDTCNILLTVQIQHDLPEAVMSTLSYLLSANSSLSISILGDIQIACDFVLWELTKIVTNEERNDDKLDFLKNIVSSFKPIMPSLLNWSASLESLKHIEAYSNISRYITFFSLVLELHANGDESVRASNSGASIPPNEDAKSVNDRQKTSSGNNKNYTMNPRMAVMTPQQEGTMFDPITVVKAIGVVASSIVDRPILNEKEREEFYAQMRISWERVFVLLSSSHILLEIQARQLANNLSCFKNGPMDGALVGMDRLVSELCKKIFNIPVADLELATHLLCSLAPDQTLKILQELRRWIGPKNNVRNMLNIIRVSLFILLIQNHDMAIVKQTIIWFELAQWQKRLFKQGINIGYTQLKRDGVFELLANFAKIQLPFWLLKEFCQEMKANTPDIMLNYALELCKFSACLANDPERFKNCIETAKAALKEMNVADERVGFILNRTINELCPYNYEAIDLLLGKLQELHKQGILFNEAKTNARIIDSFKLMKFLRLYKRQGSIMPIEIRWYKQFVNPKYYEMSMLTKSGQAETFDETVGLAMGEVTIMQQIGQQQPAGAHYSQRFESLLHESNLPKSAKERLPFHLFMLEDKESVDKFQTFFVYNEMTIYNVQLWISLVESTEVILQHSRTNLLVGSINSYVREVVKYKREISQDDLNQINMLIYDSHNRLSILKGLASRFQRLPLGITKISLIELCCDVVDKWLQHAEELQIESGKEREQYEQNRLTLLRLLAVLNTEHLLEQNGLYDSDTATLTQKSNELISHLLCNAKIDWTDSEYLEKYFALIKRIGIIHGVELEEIFVELINRSIPGTNEQYEAGIVRVSADPDSTIDFMGSTGVQLLATGTNEDSEFAVPILYNDPQITRIVMLLKQIQNPMEKITEMLQRYNLDTAILPGGYMTKIRIATCILRFLTNVQMQEFGMNSNQFGVQLVSLLNQRLYSICRIEISANELQDSDKKLDFVRSILSPQSIYRQTPEMAHFLVCLIIDNDIKELNLLGKVAQRLLQLRLPWLLFEFLKYVRAIRDKDIKSIANMPTYYCRTFEALFNTIDCSNDRAEVQRLIYFLISCPVEGGNQFAHAQSQLSAAHAQIAAALVSIAANSVADTSEYVQKNDGTVNYDVKLDSAKMT